MSFLLSSQEEQLDLLSFSRAPSSSKTGSIKDKVNFMHLSHILSVMYIALEHQGAVCLTLDFRLFCPEQCRGLVMFPNFVVVL